MPTLLAFLLFFTQAFTQTACRGTAPATLDDVPVEIQKVALDIHQTPVVVLKEKAGNRRLAIWIGTGEAHSIAVAIDDHEAARPNTHDLTTQIIEELEGKVLRVVVTELRGSTYYAHLFLHVGGDVVEVDSRPSDAIAIALRTDAPIFVRAQLFQSAAQTLDPEDLGQSI